MPLLFFSGSIGFGAVIQIGPISACCCYLLV